MIHESTKCCVTVVFVSVERATVRQVSLRTWGNALLFIAALWLLSASGLRAQICKPTGNGCANPGSACSPIANPGKSSASMGTCTDTFGPNPLEFKCECLGKLDVTPPPPPIRDFDLVTTFLDANGFPLNPKWGQQVRDNTIPTPKASCPVNSTQTLDWTSSPQYPNCTSYPVTFNGASGFPCGHHINFLTVTYEGTATWNGGPTNLWPTGDQDYSINVTRDDDALYSMAGQQAHAEFDSTETVNNWDGTGTWWERFHNSGVQQGDDRAGQMINGRHVIVVGLLGMDSYHDGKTELHPVYAMFVLLSEDRRLRRSIWSFFVRNWGNEGYCGGDQENMFVPSIRIQIPHVPSLHSLDLPTKTELVGKTPLWYGARNTDDLSGMSMQAQPNLEGILLTFNLLSPDKQSWWLGDFTFQETKAPGGTSPVNPQPLTTAKSEEELPPAFAALQAQIDQLPKRTQKRLLARQQSAIPIKPGRPAPPLNTAEPTQLGNRVLSPPGIVVAESNMIRPSKDSEGELNRNKQLEILRKYLLKRGMPITF